MIDDSINTLELCDVCDHLGIPFDDLEHDHITVGQVYGGMIPAGTVTYTVILDRHTNILIMVRTLRSMFAVTHDTLLNQVSP